MAGCTHVCEIVPNPRPVTIFQVDDHREFFGSRTEIFGEKIIKIVCAHHPGGS